MAPKQTFKIHWNGGRPYKVEVSDGKFNVFKEKPYVSWNAPVGYQTKPLIKDQPFLKFYHGKDPAEHIDNNTVLFRLDNNRYLWIGNAIKIFELPDDDEAVSFTTRLGNSDVPYPFIEGAKNTYLMLDEVYYPNSYRKDKDPYQDYYHTKPDSGLVLNQRTGKLYHPHEKLFPNVFKNFKTRVLDTNED